MARIPLFPTDNMSPAQQAVYDAIVSGPRGKIQGPLRAALHNAELADKWQQLGALLRYRTTLEPRLSELAILVTARHWDSQFEWYAHGPIAEKAGVPVAVMERIALNETPEFDKEDESVVYLYSKELLEKHNPSDETYDYARALLNDLGVVELTALVGYYSMVAMTLNAHEIPMPEGTPDPLPVIDRS